MALRPTTREEIPLLARMEARLSGHPWTERMFEEELALGSLCLTAWVGAQVVGYGVIRPMGDMWDLLLLGVDQPWQRQGHGRALVEGLLAGARSGGAHGVVLEVRAGNRGARELYGRLGFQPVGLRRGYYAPDGEDAVVMSLRWPSM